MTREHPETGADELLVFDVPGLPEFKAIVPGGGIEEGESVEEAAVREVREEAGVDVEVVRELGVAENRDPQYAAHYVEAKPNGLLPDTWRHLPAGAEDDGDAFVECRWVSIRRDLDLWGLRGAFAHALVRKRVVAYVTREHGGRTELLVFDEKAEPGRTQVPAGRIDAHESLEQGLRREVEEETGLTDIRIVGELADARRFEQLFGPGAHESHAFHAVVEGEGTDAWEHAVTGAGMDAGLVFLCRWVPLDDCPPLWGDVDPLVEELRRSITSA